MNNEPGTIAAAETTKQTLAHEPFRPIVVAPTYNNSATVIDVLERITRIGLPLIVINDGSTDETADRLASWQASTTGDCHLLSHDVNRGKATALQTGFAEAARRQYTHAITIDTDGQLAPEEIPYLIDAARTSPHAFILGVRLETNKEIPSANRVGWYFSSLGIHIETGLTLPDTQCGFRVYPLRLFETVRCDAKRYGFESEVITRAHWAGHPIIEVPVTCHYEPADRQVSHFRPYADGFSGVLFHARLTARRLSPIPFAQTPRPAICQSVSSEAGFVLRLLRWLSPARVCRQAIISRLDQLFLATAVGVGIFLTCLPLSLFLPAVALYVAWRLHLHPLCVLTGTLVALTPVGSGLLAGAVTVGHLLLHASLPHADIIDAVTNGSRTLLFQAPFTCLLGGFTVGFFAQWFSVAMLVGLFRWIPIASDSSRRSGHRSPRTSAR